MWFLVLVISMACGAVAGYATGIVNSLISVVMRKVSWFRTVVFSLAGVVVLGLFFDAFHKDHASVAFFIGALIGSGAVAWLIHRAVGNHLLRKLGYVE